MKQTYCNPLGVKHAAKIMSRRFTNIPFMSIAYKTDAPAGDGGDDGDGSDKTDKRKEDELLATIQKRFDIGLATRATKEEIKKLKEDMQTQLSGVPIEQLRAMADDKTGVLVQMADMRIQMQKMEERVQKATQTEDLSMRGQIMKWRETNKASIEAIKGGQKSGLTPLEFRVAASPMTVATVNAGSSPYIGRVEIEPGINDFVRTQPFFFDFLTKGRTNAPTYGWVNKINPQGAAGWLAPGAAKPGVSFSMESDVSVAKKIADSAKTVTELLEDIDGMETFIEQELKYQVMIKVNSTLMDNVGSNTEPTGIKQLSSAYTLTTVKTKSPNYMDALRAVVAQLRSGYLSGDIDIFINSIDAANMDLSKANDSGVYLLPPFVTADGRIIAGARVHEDVNIPVGQIQAGFLKYYRILIYKPFTVNWGWENDDFTKNMVTAVGEMRLHQFFNDQYTGAFVRSDFDTVKAAIDAGA